MGRLKTRVVWLVLLVFISAAVALAAGRSQDKNASAAGHGKAGLAASADPSQFVGAETCATCHEDASKAFAHNPHAKEMKSDPNAGCESCHGPGKAHVEAGGDKSLILNPKTMGAAAVAENCLSCHNESHPEFETSRHMKNGVTCTSCHSVHTPKAKVNLLAEAQPNLCYTCHTNVKAEFNKPFRHRVNEKLIGCSDCHNPHGTTEHAQLKMTNSLEQTCNRCHTEKSGPFVFEHTPVKADGCMSCHTPHGSANARMLTRPTVNLLCLECHTQTPMGTGSSTTVLAPVPAGPSHTQSQRYQACTVCHTQVHGSNFSAVFFK